MHRGLTLRIRIATALLIVQVVCGTLSAVGQSKKATLLTGQEGKYYHLVGRAIQCAMLGRGIEIELIPTSGSQENINKLKHGDADFAIVQGDVAHDFWHNDPRFRRTNPKACCEDDLHATSTVSLVAPLFVEKVQILTGSHLYISSLADLNPKKLWLGVEGSGTRVTALEILRAAKVDVKVLKTAEENTAKHKTLDEDMGALKEGTLEGVFETSVAPRADIAGALADPEIQLLSLERGLVEKIVRDGIYIETFIPKNTYENLDHGVLTVGVQALLLARNDTDAWAVGILAKTLQRNPDDVESELKKILRKEHVVGPAKLTLLGTQPSKHLRQYAHRSAAEFLPKSSLRHETLRHLMELAGIGLLALILTLALRGGRKLLHSNAVILLALLVGFLTWLDGAIWLQAIEGDMNEHFTTLPASAWSLAANVIASLHLPFLTAPSATTVAGQEALSEMSSLGVLMVGGIIIPLVKKIWDKSLKPRLAKSL